MKKFLLFPLLLLFIQTAFAQKFTCTGTVEDTMNIKKVVFASVSAIRKSDSVLIKSNRTDQQGRFSISLSEAGNYILLVSHSQYIDYIDEFEVNETKTTVDMGKLPLMQRGQLLKEIVIKSAPGIKIKGDTLEFLADSFKVKQGATVEDLLKVLPGLQVNKKGEITAMGEKVEKVLVDGEEFFGDDPTIATQNLQSKIVEKVQVFDKKSDQAQFTGFDDGNTQKTINLKLKKGMNKGEFGKVEASAGPNDRWAIQAMANSFRDKEKFSVYGLSNSIGKTGLGWDDRNAYTGQSENIQMSEDGNFTMNESFNSDDIGGGGWNNSIPEGITKSYVGGAHYSNRWNETKEHANINYSFGRINKKTNETNNAENLFPQNRFQSRDSSATYNSRNAHRLTAKYDFAIDTNTTIYYDLAGRLNFTDNSSYSLSNNKYYTEQPISKSERNNNTESTSASVSNSFTVNHKLKKTGRTVSVNANYDYRKSESFGILTGENDYYLNGNKQELLDQKKQNTGLTHSAGVGLTYTEPLGKKILLKLSYNYNTDRTNSLKTTEVKNNSSDYNELVDSLSNDFHSNVNSNTVGLEFKYNEKKYSLTLGSRIRRSSFKQEDLIRLYQYNYNRINLFPTLRFNYKFSQFSRVTFNYSGSTTQPSISQIQPIQDNSNPLVIYVGNPNLKIGYSQSINLNYFNYKVLSSRSVYAGIWGTNQYNNVSNNRRFDELGRTIVEYVNLNGYYSTSLWAGYSAKIPKTPLEGKINLNYNYTHSPNIANNIKSITTNSALSITPGLTWSKENAFYTSLELGTTYNDNRTTQQNGRDVKFISFNPTYSFIKYIKDFEIGTDIDYVYNPPVDPYPNKFTRMLWGAYASYKLLPNRNLELKATISDILNQNKGYERTTTNNYNNERRFLTLGRYWMVGFVYNFKHGAMAEAKGKPGSRPTGMGPGGGRRGGGVQRRIIKH